MTINQRIRKRKEKRDIKEKKERNKLSQPQIKGLIIKVYTMTPKKPNSALRKVAKVRIKDPKDKKERIVVAYIPGEKHTLSIHNLVLLRPGKTKDLPGVKYKVIRGVLDCK